MIEVRGLSVVYPTHTAVRDVSFTLPEGSVTAFLGRNGAGKTSTLRALLGFIRMSEGSAKILGRPVRFADVSVRRSVGYVSERPHFPESRRVAEILHLARRLIPDWSDDEARTLVERLRINTAAKVGTLSKGQRARLALLLALAHRPRVLILDEPTGGLDPVIRREFLDEMLRHVTSEGRSVLVSTHIVSEIDAVADRVLLLSRGRLVFSDTVEKATRGGEIPLEEWFIRQTAGDE